MTAQHGEAYAAYHHTKVLAVTDWLARSITAALGFNDQSDECRAMRMLCSEWRDARYSALQAEGKQSENRFLLEFDAEYRVRRVAYLCRFIDARISRSTGAELDWLIGARAGLGRLLRHMQNEIAQFSVRPPDAKLPSEDSRRTLLAVLNGERAPAPILDSAAQALECLGETLRPLFIDSAGRMSEILEPLEGVAPALREAWLHFETQDAVTLPLLLGAALRECGPIEVYRVSPEESDLRPETAESGAEKLGGVKFGAFGAFLSVDWRRNDLIWGRLDGAERILTAILPNEANRELRTRLIDAARREILREETGGDDPAIFARGFLKGPGPTPEQGVRWLARALQIAGEMIGSLPGGGRTGRALRFAGVSLCRLLDFALPGNLQHLLTRHWLRLIELAALLLLTSSPWAGWIPGVVGAATLTASTLVRALAWWLKERFLNGGRVWNDPTSRQSH